MAFPAFNLGNKEDLPVCVCGCFTLLISLFCIFCWSLTEEMPSGCKELAPDLDEIHSEKQICIFIYKDTLQRILSFLLELQYLVSSANLYYYFWILSFKIWRGRSPEICFRMYHCSQPIWQRWQLLRLNWTGKINFCY